MNRIDQFFEDVPMSEDSRREPSAETIRIANRLNALRRQQGISQLELCKKLDLTQSMMSRYENGTRRIPSELLIQFAKAIGVSSDEILGLKSVTPRSNPFQDMTDEMKHLWKKFQLVAELPDNDQRAVIRLINSLAKPKAQPSRKSKSKAAS
jgi:transcriptional regulator with XRE-family HTH domain